MRRAMVVLVVMPLLLSAGWAAEQGGVIKVAGQAMVEVAPDQVSVSFSVRVEGKEVAPARQQAADRMSKIIAAIRDLKLDDMVLSTESFYVRPIYKPLSKDVNPYGGPGGEEIAREAIGYAVTNTGRVQLNGPPEMVAPAISRVIDIAVKQGATTVGNPSFSKRDTKPALRQALEAATRDALENAQAIARGLSVTTTGYRFAGMFSEAEHDQYYDIGTVGVLADAPPPPGPGGPGGPPGTSTPVEVRSIMVTATVFLTATY